jgi:long-chain acyl-CoA synthetase
MLYTSGTTGYPKGVRKEPDPAGLVLGVAVYGHGDADAHLCTGPLYHAAPLAFSLAMPLAFGSTVVLMDRWDAEDALRLIDEHQVTHTHMVPTMFHRLLAIPEEERNKRDVSKLRYVIHGAAPCPVQVKKALIDWLGPVVYEYYAATEGTGTWVDPHTWLTKPGTVGRVVPDDHILIADDNGTELPRGSVGTIYLKAPDVGRFEYFKDGAKTESAYIGDYYTLGDVGFVDDDGFLFLTDRSTNLIIFGGSNVYPAEVDNVLLDHAAVLDVATIGVPDAEWGEVVKAVVELAPGVEGSPELEAELIEFTRERLAHFKCPRTVEFVEQLPRDDNGKIYKRRLRDQYRAPDVGVQGN